MSRLSKLAILAVLLGLLLVPSYGGKPRPVIQLKATFRDAVAVPPAACPYDTYLDKILSDSLKEYVTNGSVQVVIYADYGDLYFEVGQNSGRSARFIFPPTATPCGFLPDTANIYNGSVLCNSPDLPYEPVTYFRFRMYNQFWSVNGQTVDLLKMLPGEIRQVRLQVIMDTAARTRFVLKYDPSQAGNETGVVMVLATDKNGDNIVDRWEFYPRDSPNDQAIAELWPKGNKGICTFGTFPMPFRLILDRVQ